MALIIVAVLRIIFGTLGLAANVVQFVTTVKMKKDLKPFDVTVISLNIADAMSSLLFALYGLARILFIYGIIGNGLFAFLAIGINFSIVASFNHIIFIALQRMFAVIFPLSIRSIITNRRFNACLALMWLTAIAYAVTCTFKAVDFLAVNSYTILLSGLVLIGLYSLVCIKTMRKSRPRLSIHGNRAQGHGVLLHSIFISLGFVVCFFPFAINYLFVTYNFVSVLVADVLVMLNTFVNVMVYFLMRYRRVTRKRRTLSNISMQLRPNRACTATVVTAIALQECNVQFAEV